MRKKVSEEEIEQNKKKLISKEGQRVAKGKEERERIEKQRKEKEERRRRPGGGQ